MKIYIGYKYKNNKDKTELQNNLERISKKFEEIGHSCFVLGRDVHGWNINHISTSKSVSPIISNIRKSDVLFAFIDNQGESLGLRFEALCAKVLGRKIIVAVKSGLSEKFFRTLAGNTLEFESVEELLVKIPGYLQNLNP